MNDIQMHGRLSWWWGCLLALSAFATTPLQAQPSQGAAGPAAVAGTPEPTVATPVDEHAKLPHAAQVDAAPVPAQPALAAPAGAVQALPAKPSAAAPPGPKLRSAPPAAPPAAPAATSQPFARRPEFSTRDSRPAEVRPRHFDFDGVSFGLGLGMFLPQHRGWKRIIGEDALPLGAIMVGYDFALSESLRLTLDANIQVGEHERAEGGLTLGQTQALLGARLSYLVQASEAVQFGFFGRLAAGGNRVSLKWHGNQELALEELAGIGSAGLGLEGRLSFSDGPLHFMGATVEFGAQGGTRVDLKPDNETDEDSIPVRYASFGELGMFAPFARVVLFLGF